MLYIMAAISIASLATISYLSMSLGSSHERFYQMIYEKNNYVFVRDDVNFVIKNPIPFSKILQISQTDNTCNQTLRCIYERTDCAATLATVVGEDISGSPATGPNAFHSVNCLYDHTGTNITFRGSIATNGLDRNGQPCNSYDPANPDQDCIYRPDVKWRPMCTGAPCFNPQLEMRIDLKFANRSKMSLNTSKRVIRTVVVN